MVNVEQLKSSVNRMSADVVRDAVNELRLDGLVTEGKTPFNKVHFNTCFAEIEALFQRAGYHKQLDVVGYQGLLYALYDPGRWEAVDVLRWLKEFTEAAKVYDSGPAQNRNSLRRCLCSPAGKQKGRAPLREHVLFYRFSIRRRSAYSWGPAETRALPCSLPSYFLKFLMKRLARSLAFSSHWEASA